VSKLRRLVIASPDLIPRAPSVPFAMLTLHGLFPLLAQHLARPKSLVTYMYPYPFSLPCCAFALPLPAYTHTLGTRTYKCTHTHADTHCTHTLTHYTHPNTNRRLDPAIIYAGYAWRRNPACVRYGADKRGLQLWERGGKQRKHCITRRCKKFGMLKPLPRSRS
jgi:hypothetical protein